MTLLKILPLIPTPNMSFLKDLAKDFKDLKASLTGDDKDKEKHKEKEAEGQRGE